MHACSRLRGLLPGRTLDGLRQVVAGDGAIDGTIDTRAATAPAHDQNSRHQICTHKNISGLFWTNVPSGTRFVKTSDESSCIIIFAKHKFYFLTAIQICYIMIHDCCSVDAEHIYVYSLCRPFSLPTCIPRLDCEEVHLCTDF